jgi:hypothetical protein
MPSSSQEQPWPRAFPVGGIEILDSRLHDHGEVTLWSTGGRTPGLGELFTIEHGDAIHDLSVVAVRGHSPGWSALCRRVDAGNAFG